MRHQNTGTGILLALVCLLLLSLLPIIANSRPQGFSALSFAVFLSAWQTLFALPLFIWELRAPDKGIFSAGVSQGEKRRVLVVALITGAMFGASTYLYVLSVERAGAVNAAVAIQAYPLFAILVELVLLKRRKTRLELALTGILLAALYYLGTGGTLRLSGLSIWFLAAVGVPLLWSIAHVIIREELGRTPITPAQVTLIRVAISTLFLVAVMAVLAPDGFAVALGRAEFQIYALAMGLVYYLELVIWFYAVRHIDVSFASSITTPWPAFTMVMAALVLGDTIEPYQIGAFIVVAVSIYGLMLAGLRKAKSTA